MNDDGNSDYPVSPDTLTSDPSTWKGASLLSVTQISSSGLILLMELAEQMKILVRTHGGDHRLQHRILATCFFEASTRTACSFQAAMQRLGGTTIHVDGEGNSSANKKGETLADTMQCLECYVDLTVLRHPVTGSVGHVVAVAAKKPVINAGDGTGEHPTQALLDLYTICNELNCDLGSNNNGSNENNGNDNTRTLVIVMLGDLKHGRTVHSLSKLFARSGMKVILRYCSPPTLSMPQPIHDYVASYNIKQEIFADVDAALDGADVLYVTRIQKERFENEDDYEAVKVSRKRRGKGFAMESEHDKRLTWRCAPRDFRTIFPLYHLPPLLRLQSISTHFLREPTLSTRR